MPCRRRRRCGRWQALSTEEKKTYKEMVEEENQEGVNNRSSLTKVQEQAVQKFL